MLRSSSVAHTLRAQLRLGSHLNRAAIGFPYQRIVPMRNCSNTNSEKELASETKEKSPVKNQNSKWRQLGLSEKISEALIASLNLDSPTPIQTIAIPQLLAKKNILFSSQTGTGKTLTYLLPVLHNLRKEEESQRVLRRVSRPRSIVLVPNRELALQVLSYSVFQEVCSTSICWDHRRSPSRSANKNMEEQMDIVVATPGRLIEHHNSKKLFYSDVRHLVIDEADTMFDKTFLADLDKVLTPLKDIALRQSAGVQFVACGATLPKETEQLILKHLPDMQVLHTKTTHKPVAALKQIFIRIPMNGKLSELLKQIKQSKSKRIIVFCNNVDSCRAVDHLLNENSVPTACLHGEILPKRRKEEWQKFLDLTSPSRVLVCTDIAARGIDTAAVEHVILFDFPRTAVEYLHRIGRTARAKAQGTATCFVASKDALLADAIEKANQRGDSLAQIDSQLAAKKEKRLKAESSSESAHKKKRRVFFKAGDRKTNSGGARAQEATTRGRLPGDRSRASHFGKKKK